VDRMWGGAIGIAWGGGGGKGGGEVVLKNEN